MTKLLSTKYSSGAFNFGMLVLRVTLGALLISHGYAKLIRFGTLKNSFMNFAGIGSTTSLALITFAELGCGMLIVIGMFTRFASIPIIIGMSVVVFLASHGEIFGSGERGMIYLASAITILFCGPGKISVDGMIGK
jgi:putative oxidoreductase